MLAWFSLVRRLSDTAVYAISSRRVHNVVDCSRTWSDRFRIVCAVLCYIVLCRASLSVTAICTSRSFVPMYLAAFWLLIVAWQWVANKRQHSDTIRELRDTVDNLYSSRKREAALKEQLAAFNARVSELQAGKVGQEARSARR